MTADNQSKTSDEITLKELLIKLGNGVRFLLSKWFIILFFGIVGSVFGYYYATKKRPIYTATTNFVLEDGSSQGGLGNIGSLASIAGISLGSGGGDLFHGDNIIKLYKSRKMVKETLLSEVDFNGKKKLLIDTYIEINDLRTNWKDKPNLKNINFKEAATEKNRIRDSIISNIVLDINKNYLFVDKPDPELSIIKVDVKSKNEFFAKAFNDQIVKNVNDFYVQTKTKKSIDNVNILQHKTDSVRLVMNGAIYTAAKVTDATPNLNPTRLSQRVAPVQRAQFSAETNKAILAEFLKNLELSKITLLKETPLIQVIDEPIFPLQVERFGKIKGALLGGILFGFLVIFFLVASRILRKILAN
ncbi:MAG: lipopolysaccharide biosynthesis protein [Pedobacter sp.]|jgi:hypothetical protein|uniref:lipopolysaccharide biosynthesis protein n=1 Tax=Pedobacter sp. TaxID=1411316 RepID=UPI003565BEF9